MKQHVEDKLKPVVDVPNLKITSVRVVLDVEKNRCKAEIIVNMKNHDLEAVTETLDMYQAIDQSIEKIDSQIRKLLDKVQDHHRGQSVKDIEVVEEEKE
jgi:ribosomal subunit interface protein